MAVVKIDYDKVKQAAQALKQNPPTEAEILKDPKAFLAKQGVEIDDDLNTLIQSRLAAKSAGAQPSAIHIDI